MNTLNLCEEIIELNEEGNLKKYIHIRDDFLVTVDDNNIYLWNKKNKNSKESLKIQQIHLEDNMYDICKIKDNYLKYFQNSKLTFLSLENFSKKVIFDIDNVEKDNSLILINHYVLVNCENDISVISTKMKEKIQYIKDIENFDYKKIIKVCKEKIYVINSDII